MTSPAPDMNDRVASYRRLAGALARRHLSRCNDPRARYDECFAAALVAVWEACRSYDPAAGAAERSWVCGVVIRRLQDWSRKELGRTDTSRRQRRIDRGDLTTCWRFDGGGDSAPGRHDPEPADPVPLRVVMRLGGLTRREAGILSARVLDGRGLLDVGREFGFGESMASRAVSEVAALCRDAGLTHALDVLGV